MKDWLNFEYSNKQVTAHGGISLLKRFAEMKMVANFCSDQGNQFGQQYYRI